MRESLFQSVLSWWEWLEEWNAPPAVRRIGRWLRARHRRTAASMIKSL
jgi:hypothetical protein